MKKPLGLYVIIAWCLVRGIGGLISTVTMLPWVRSGIGPWRVLVFTFVFEVAIWLWLGFSLWVRWNVGRIVAVLWCVMTVVWASYGFFIASAWQRPYKWLLYSATVVIHGAIAVYLMLPRVASVFRETSDPALEPR